MFESLKVLPIDPILGLMALYKNDPNPAKVDLGVGVYRDDLGRTPVLAAVRQAEQQLLAQQVTKTYVGPAGNQGFNDGMLNLLLGSASGVRRDNRATVFQTPGGCGALRVAAELIRAARKDATVWVSDPTWANHIPLLGFAGLKIKTYPYYSVERNQLTFAAMRDALAQVPAGDVVLLHGCCHNPTGADLSREQWQVIAELAGQRGFVPFVDIAYQGFGTSLEEDVWGFRLLAETLPEVLFAVSCSKNFGLYRERVGAVGIVAERQAVTAAQTHFMSIVRGIYSMPPDHGAAIVDEILRSVELSHLWQAELTAMRERVTGLRTEFSRLMRGKLQSTRFDFVAHQKGMFSYLGINPEQVQLLSERFGIYMLQSSRVNIAGLQTDSINYVCESLAGVLVGEVSP